MAQIWFCEREDVSSLVRQFLFIKCIRTSLTSSYKNFVHLKKKKKIQNGGRRGGIDAIPSVSGLSNDK